MSLIIFFAYSGIINIIGRIAKIDVTLEQTDLIVLAILAAAETIKMRMRK